MTRILCVLGIHSWLEVRSDGRLVTSYEYKRHPSGRRMSMFKWLNRCERCCKERWRNSCSGWQFDEYS